jgi:hypothetical protein
MSIKFSDQFGEHNAGAVVEVAPVLGLDNLMDIIQGSDHNINSNNIPLWNDRPIHYLGSGSCHVFLSPLTNSELWNASRHGYANNNQQDMPKIFSKKLGSISFQKKLAL